MLSRNEPDRAARDVPPLAPDLLLRPLLCLLLSVPMVARMSGEQPVHLAGWGVR